MKRQTILWILFPLALFATGYLCWTVFERDSRPYVYMEGKALGVFYSIVYQGDESHERRIDSTITAFDQAVNTELRDSEISQFNRTGNWEFRSPYLLLALQYSVQYTEQYQGAVSHMILPLIQAWGQDFSNKQEMTPERIEELKRLCQAENLEINPKNLRAKLPGVMINLSYLDKGLLIDILSDFLLDRGIKNFQMEFGTDAISYGKTPKNNTRHIILQPQAAGPSKSSIKETPLENRAYSSSGNLEKFYIDEKGYKHSHLIDPRTGRPLENNILATHIKAPTCLEADALATLCMILTLEESSKLILDNPGLEGLIVYNKNGDLQIWKSPGFEVIEKN